MRRGEKRSFAPVNLELNQGHFTDEAHGQLLQKLNAAAAAAPRPCRAVMCFKLPHDVEILAMRRADETEFPSLAMALKCQLSCRHAAL